MTVVFNIVDIFNAYIFKLVSSLNNNTHTLGIFCKLNLFPDMFYIADMGSARSFSLCLTKLEYATDNIVLV